MTNRTSLLLAADHYLRAAIQAAHEHRGGDVAYLDQARADLEAARAKIAEREQEIEHICRSRDIYKGKLKAVKARVGNGVCPCCKRTFQNLMRHMKTKHPGFSGSEL